MGDEGDELGLGLIGAAHLLEETGVLDGNGRVVSQADDEFQRLLVETIPAGGLQGDYAGDLLLPPDGYCQLDHHPRHHRRVIGVILHILHEFGFTSPHDPPYDPLFQRPRLLLMGGDQFLRITPVGQEAQPA